MGSRYLPDYVWLTCVAFFNGCCAYCGTSNQRLTGDHLVAKSKGGLDKADNIVPSCEKCNNAKGDTEWRSFIMSLDNFNQARMNRIYEWRRVARHI